MFSNPGALETRIEKYSSMVYREKRTSKPKLELQEATELELHSANLAMAAQFRNEGSQYGSGV